MAKVRTKIAYPGDWKSPQGDTTITPERVLHWQKLHRELRGQGVRFPVPWGHLSTATPAEAGDADAEKFLSSRFNAGYLDDFEVDPEDGGGVAVLDCPGLSEEDGHLVSVVEVNGVPVKTAIKEVSPAVGGKWTDGKGREWDDIIAHVALTPLPVQMGQPGFTALGTGKAEGFFYLASRPPLAPAKKDAEGDKPADVAPELMDAAADDDFGPDDTADDEPGGPGGDPGGELDPQEGFTQSIKADLAKLGVELPEMTDASNIVEHLSVALHTLVSRCDAERAEQDRAGAKTMPQQQPKEVAAPGVMLATLKAENPVAYTLALGEDQRQRKRRAARIEALKGRGLPAALANKLAAESQQTQLSLDPSGRALPGRIDRDLWLLGQVLPAADSPQNLLSSAAPEPTPAEQPAEGVCEKDEDGLVMTKEMAEDIKARAGRYSAPARR